MLHRRRMEYEVRRMGSHDFAHTQRIPDIRHHSRPWQMGMTEGKLHVDLVEMEFRVIDQRQLRRPEIGNLAHKLAADCPARARNQDARSADHFRHGGPVQNGFRASQQILDRDGLDLDVVVDPGRQLGQTRCSAQCHAEYGRFIEQAAHCHRRKPVLGHDEPLRPVSAGFEAFDDSLDLVHPAQHLDPVDAAAQIGTHLVDYADDAIQRHGIARQCAEEQFRAVAGADQQQRNAAVAAAVALQRGLPAVRKPGGKPGRCEQREQHQPVDDDDRGRKAGQRRHQGPDGHEYDVQQRGRLGDRDHVLQRNVAPEAAIKPHGKEHAGGDKPDEDESLYDRIALGDQEGGAGL
jgi:hypothetical protein